MNESQRKKCQSIRFVAMTIPLHKRAYLNASANEKGVEERNLIHLSNYETFYKDINAIYCRRCCSVGDGGRLKLRW
jgi:hypothetical protein